MTTKLCCYCHGKPRRPKSPYCSDKCRDAKYRINHSDPEKRRRQLNHWRAEQREKMKAEYEREAQEQRDMLEQARKLLNEPDDTPHRLRPEQKIKMWHIITGKIEEVKL